MFTFLHISEHDEKFMKCKFCALWGDFSTQLTAMSKIVLAGQSDPFQFFSVVITILRYRLQNYDCSGWHVNQCRSLSI